MENEQSPEVSSVYAKRVVADGELGTEISTFQHHFIAFTGIVYESLEQPIRIRLSWKTQDVTPREISSVIRSGIREFLPRLISLAPWHRIVPWT